MKTDRWSRAAIVALAGVGIVLAALSAAPSPVRAQTIDVGAIDGAVERIRAEIGIPGVAIAVVSGDSVVHLRGYGVREAGTDTPVGSGTLFAIGSATKAFTATLVGMLVDEGRLDWDDHMADRLPGFALADPYRTAELTIRDALAHRSGLPAANLMWLPRDQPPDTLLRRLRYLEPTAAFRAAFSYQNLLYLAVGRVLEEATGRSWSALLEERILGPLGMRDTNASVAVLDDRTDVATPHVRAGSASLPVPYRVVDEVAPAGAINSSARDMAEWLRFLLSGGETDGARLIEAATLAETRTAQTVVPTDPITTAFHPAARLQAYGLGWFLSDFHGRTLVAHGGGIDGMSALVGWLPEEELGVAILANLQTRVPVWTYGLLYAVLDSALGVGPTPWEEPYRRAEALIERLTGDGSLAEKVDGTPPSLPLDAYIGAYVGRTIGEVEIADERDGGLSFAYGTLSGRLEHWHHDTFRVAWSDAVWRSMAGSGWITFRLDRSGTVEGMTLEALPGETYWLARRLAPVDSRRAR